MVAMLYFTLCEISPMGLTGKNKEGGRGEDGVQKVVMELKLWMRDELEKRQVVCYWWYANAQTCTNPVCVDVFCLCKCNV